MLKQKEDKDQNKKNGSVTTTYNIHDKCRKGTKKKKHGGKRQRKGKTKYFCPSQIQVPGHCLFGEPQFTSVRVSVPDPG